MKVLVAEVANRLTDFFVLEFNLIQIEDITKQMAKN